MYILEANNIVKQYENHLALSGVSISVEEGKIFGLLGPNGAGKTTLIRVINRITAPDTGEVIFGGEALSAKHLKDIGYLPEERGLYKKMEVGEQAIYLAMLRGLSRQEAIKRLKFWFDKYDIGKWWKKKVMELSKGMQQKIQFICTVIHEPKLLILDEPFSGFDPINADILKEEVLRLKSEGSTIIFSTHQMASAEEMCDNIALINNSSKVLDGKISEIKQKFYDGRYKLSLREPDTTLISDLNRKFNIINQPTVPSDGSDTLTLNIKAESSEELLKEVIGRAQIREFSEKLPTLHEIFIQRVGETKSTASSTASPTSTPIDK